MSESKTEYWVVCFYKQWPPFELRVSYEYFHVAARPESATIIIDTGTKKGKWLIESKKQFSHLNKNFLIAEVTKINEPVKSKC